MTSKTSFFNYGIYKSTIKRFVWGSILYFVILFMATGLSILSNNSYDPSDIFYYSENPVILNGSYMGFPMVLAIIVPTVTALLVFRFIHSKKQVVFTNSLPVCRKSNYISSLLGGFTLMAAPVVVNTVVLIIMSLCGYGKFFSIQSCFVWLGYNLLGLFMMYSCAVFSAVITGNSFAMIVINVVVHSFLFISAAALSLMAEVFVYGIPSTNAVIDAISENNFVVLTMNMAYNTLSENISLLRIIEYTIIPMAIYVGSYYIYKFRKAETASDVAGFKALGSVLKYMITFLATIFTFAIFAENINANSPAFFVATVLICAITYFGSEMLIKKSFSVFGSYKGYICFVVLFSALVSVFAFTSFFGYETRIPPKNEIAEVAIYDYYYQNKEPYTNDKTIIDQAVNIHNNITKKIPVTGERVYDTRIHIKYKLKNGEIVYRVYPITYDKCKDFMNKIYENEEYKKKCERVFIDESQIIRITVNDGDPLADKSGILAALRSDVLNMSYEDLNMYQHHYTNPTYGIHIEYEVDKGNNRRYGVIVSTAYINVTSKYTNTLKWLTDNGFKPYY